MDDIIEVARAERAKWDESKSVRWADYKAAQSFSPPGSFVVRFFDEDTKHGIFSYPTDEAYRAAINYGRNEAAMSPLPFTVEDHAMGLQFIQALVTQLHLKVRDPAFPYHAVLEKFGVLQTQVHFRENETSTLYVHLEVPAQGAQGPLAYQPFGWLSLSPAGNMQELGREAGGLASLVHAVGPINRLHDFTVFDPRILADYVLKHLCSDEAWYARRTQLPPVFPGKPDNTFAWRSNSAPRGFGPIPKSTPKSEGEAN